MAPRAIHWRMGDDGQAHLQVTGSNQPDDVKLTGAPWKDDEHPSMDGWPTCQGCREYAIEQLGIDLAAERG